MFVLLASLIFLESIVDLSHALPLAEPGVRPSFPGALEVASARRNMRRVQGVGWNKCNVDLVFFYFKFFPLILSDWLAGASYALSPCGIFYILVGDSSKTPIYHSSSTSRKIGRIDLPPPYAAIAKIRVTNSTLDQMRSLLYNIQKNEYNLDTLHLHCHFIS